VRASVFLSALVALVGLVLSPGCLYTRYVAQAANGQFQFRFRGAIGERYAIESSDNLQSWTRLWTFTNSSASSVFVDPDTTNLTNRFYRAILLP
jgi:hypothetical protein